MLLDPPLAANAEALAARLRRLPVVEPFPARGPGAANVHEATRLALRARMKAESPERLRALSARARVCFAGDATPHTRIEALYHRFTAEPEAAVWECGALAEEWGGAGRYEALLGLGVVLGELLQERLPEGLVRGAAFYAMSQDLLGNVLLAQGDLPSALDAYRASLDIRQRLAQADPSNTTAQRNVSVSHNKIGDVLRDQGDLAEALAAHRASLAIAEHLAARDPAHAQWQTELAEACQDVAGVLLALPEGDHAEARRLVARGLERMEALAQAHPPTPYEQQVRAGLEALRGQAD